MRNNELIQLTHHGVVFSGSVADLRALRAQYQRDHYLILPRLIEPELFATVLQRLRSAPCVPREDDGIVLQSIIEDPLTFNLLNFLISAPEFQRLMQRITGCRRIANFEGRIYRLNPGTGERLVWHTDVCEHRMVTFSLNLSAGEFRGGTLQIRRRDSQEILHEVHNTGPGDALLMRVAKKLCHRVLPVEGDVPRTALAGWFRWQKDNVNFHHGLRRASKNLSAKAAAGEYESIAAGRR
jgi:hypothetical protein